MPNDEPGAVMKGGDRCAAPTRVTLSGGRAFIADETLTSSDEFPALDCHSRGTAGPLAGPQRYYVLSVQKDRSYRFALTPAFHAVFFGFEATVACSQDAIEQACRSNDARGFSSGLINPGTGTPGAPVFAVPPLYRAERDTELVLVVDSDGGSGIFELSIIEENAS